MVLNPGPDPKKKKLNLSTTFETGKIDFLRKLTEKKKKGFRNARENFHFENACLAVLFSQKIAT